MSSGRWELMSGIYKSDPNKLPESDSEDESDDSLSKRTVNEEESQENELLRIEAETRILRCGHSLVTDNYQLKIKLSISVGDRYMHLLTELYDTNYLQFKNEIHHRFNQGGRESFLDAGIEYIYERNTPCLTWNKILTALMKIKRWDVLRDLFDSELDDYWERLACRNAVKGAKEAATGRTLHTKEPVESLDSDMRPQNFGVASNLSQNNLQDSGICNSRLSEEQELSNGVSNIVIGRSGGSPPTQNQSSVHTDPNANRTSLPFPSVIPPYQIGNNFYQWFQMGCSPSSFSSYPIPMANNNQMVYQMANSLHGFLPMPQPLMANTLTGLPTQAMLNAPASGNVVNNSLHSLQRNQTNNMPTASIPRPLLPSYEIEEMNDLRVHVFLTYSLDAENEAKALKSRLWENYRIFAMTSWDMVKRPVHSSGVDVSIRCDEAKYVVPILSRKYIADIDKGHLLNDPNYLNTLYCSDKSKEDRRLVSSIYTQYVGMCFNNGGRNEKVRPLYVIENSFGIRQGLAPCLHNAWHLWNEFEDFVDVIAN